MKPSRTIRVVKNIILLCMKKSKYFYSFKYIAQCSKWRWVGKIAALLQAFGFSGGLWGLANVLQCGIAKTPLAKSAVG